MLKKLIALGGALLMLAPLLIVAPLPASADQTGFASMHDLRRERGRLCMASHFHSGSSNGQRSRKAAQRAAMRSWASFTAMEYGTDWARVSRARSKSMKCSKSGGGWGCYFEARPCL